MSRRAANWHVRLTYLHHAENGRTTRRLISTFVHGAKTAEDAIHAATTMAREQFGVTDAEVFDAREDR